MDLATLATEAYDLSQQYLDIIAEQSREIDQLKAKLVKYEAGDKYDNKTV